MRHWVVLILFLFALGTLRVVACGEDPSCVDDEDCDDGNPCTRDYCYSYDPDAPLTCEVVQRCRHSPVTEGTSCGSGNVCVHGVCGENLCEGVVCDDENVCTEDEACDYVDGTCEFTAVGDGIGCTSEFCCACSESGIRAAIQAGGNQPYTFDCDGPKTVVTNSTIEIYNDVILNGEGNLTVDASDGHRVFAVGELVTVELRGLAATGGKVVGGCGGGIFNQGHLVLQSSTLSGNTASDGGGVCNLTAGILTLTSSTVSGNSANRGGGVYQSGGTVMLTNSTVSANAASEGGGIYSDGSGPVTLTNSTVSGNSAGSGSAILLNPLDSFPIVVATAALIDGACAQQGEVTWTSNGYNIESPGDTCDFDQGSDLVEVSSDDLKLGPLANKGGPTMTHALGVDSVAIDHIGAVDCAVTEDQRGEPRPETGGDACDVGSFERQPEDP